MDYGRPGQRPGQRAFYESLGYAEIRDHGAGTLRAFVRLDRSTGVLTDRLAERVRRDFGARADAVLDVLAGVHPEATERVLAAVVLAAAGDTDRLGAAVDLARLDWGDLLVETGLEGADWPERLDRELGGPA